MGRTDAVPLMRELAAEWQRLGARVTFEPGWETRTNGSKPNYEGAIVHHTASASSAAKPNPTRSILINGRTDLSGPLCNVTGPWCADGDPWLHVISAGPANHAGASGGKSMGPLPVTTAFNARVLGLEIDYSGVAPMTAGQYRAALIFARGVATVLKRSVEYVRAHAETSVTGKYDPGYAPGKTIDMAAFRRDAAALTAPAAPATPEDDMPTIDDFFNRQIPGGEFWRVIADTRTDVGLLRTQVTGLTSAVSTLSTVIAQGRDDLTADELKRAVQDAIAESVVKVDVNVAGGA